MKKINIYIYYITSLNVFLLPFPMLNSQVGVLSLLAFFLYLIQGDLKNKLILILKNKALVLVFSFIVFNYISILYSFDKENALDSVKYYKYYWFLAPVIYTSFSAKQARDLLSIFLFSMFLYAVMSLLIYFGFLVLKDSNSLNPEGIMAYAIVSPLLAFCALISLFRFLQKDKFRYLYLGLFVFFLLVLFINKGRAGQIALILSLIIFFIFYLDFKKLILSLLAFGLCLFLIFNFTNRFQEGIKQIENSLKSEKFIGSWGVRAGAHFASYYILKQAPLFGFGAGDNIYEYQKIVERNPYKLSAGVYLGGLHSLHLNILSKLGILPYLLFVFFIFYTLFKYRKNKEVFLVLFALFSITFIDGLFDVILFMKPYNNFFIIILSLALAQARQRKKTDYEI